VGNIWKYETHNDDLHDLRLSSILLGWLNEEKIFREGSKHGFKENGFTRHGLDSSCSGLRSVAGFL